MTRIVTAGVWIAGLCALAWAARAVGQETRSDAERTKESGGQSAESGAVEKQAAEEQVAEGAVALPGPKYFNLRYDEDFSYLDGGPGTYEEDFFDPIKNIKLGDDFRLSIGGEFRFRMDAETNKTFDSARRTQDTFQLYRYFLHFDLKYRDTARVFMQLGSMHDEDRDLPDRPTDENHFTIHQLFVDVKPLGDGTPLTARVGRQELQYGNEHLVSPLDWANVRRRFDAVKLIWRDDLWNFDVFYAKPVVVSRKQRDEWNEEFDFYGAYLTYRGITDHGLDLFFFAVDDTQDRRNPNGRAGDVSRYTLGSRFWGRTGNFDYEALLAGQWGRWAGNTIQAWAWLIDGGYTFDKFPLTPRIGTGFDWASGDEEPADGKVGTFDQLFPLGHKYFGFLDLVGRQNVTAVNVNLTAWPVAKKVKSALAYHVFWLNAAEDALYDAAGNAGRRDPTGSSGREVGHELDLTLQWEIDRHQSLLFGYAHFWDSTFITNTGPSEDPDFIYLQYTFKF